MDSENGKNWKAEAIARWQEFREWLLRPGTIRLVAPAAFILAFVMIASGVILLPDGGGSRPWPNVGEDDFGVGPGGLQPGTSYRVPPEMVEAYSALVPPLQPYAGFDLSIDELGVQARVVELGLGPKAVPQVPNTASKVAWYDFSSRPGEGSNAVIAGHVRWAGDRGVFADIEDLDEGDKIRLDWRNGDSSTYEVTEVTTVDPEDKDSVRVMDPTDRDILTLITCSGKFEADSGNPLGGDFTERAVVKAKLVQRTAVSSAED